MHRAHAMCSAVARAYPNAFKQLDHWHSPQGREGLPKWPDCVYVPLSGAYAIASGGGDRRVPAQNLHHVGVVGGLGAWRMGKLVLRFDPDLASALLGTPFDGTLPADVLQHLPAWCVYIEAPAALATDMAGFFAFLDDDPTQGLELRILVDRGADPGAVLDPGSFFSLPLPLMGGKTLDQALGYLRVPSPSKAQTVDAMAGMIKPLLPLVLYLCSDGFESSAPIANPAPTRIKGGPRLFAAEKTTTIGVGERIGAALRLASQSHGGSAQSSDQESGRHVTPHLRRAHWHVVLSGPRLDAQGNPITASQRRRELRWFPPVLVGAKAAADDLPTTLRDVKP